MWVKAVHMHFLFVFTRLLTFAEVLSRGKNPDLSLDSFHSPDHSLPIVHTIVKPVVKTTAKTMVQFVACF